MKTFFSNSFRALFANAQLPQINSAAPVLPLAQMLMGGTERAPFDPRLDNHFLKTWGPHPQHPALAL